jgi:hypothetical protein
VNTIAVLHARVLVPPAILMCAGGIEEEQEEERHPHRKTKKDLDRRTLRLDFSNCEMAEIAFLTGDDSS